MADDWRRMAATLADPVRRQAYASVVLGVPIDLPSKKRDKALAALVAAGLVIADGDNFVVADDAFTALLAASPVVTRTGVDRFVRDGRIVQYPVRADDRLEVLTWARDRALPSDTELSQHELPQHELPQHELSQRELSERELSERELSEREFGERLSELTSDVAALRRHLVDAGLVIRDADGRRYRRAP